MVSTSRMYANDADRSPQSTVHHHGGKITCADEVDCSHYIILCWQALSNISMGCASVCLALRTWALRISLLRLKVLNGSAAKLSVAIWKHSRSVLVVLVTIGLVQWAFLLRGSFYFILPLTLTKPTLRQDISFRRAQWVLESGLCLVIPIPLSGLLFLYVPSIYTCLFWPNCMAHAMFSNCFRFCRARPECHRAKMGWISAVPLTDISFQARTSIFCISIYSQFITCGEQRSYFASTHINLATLLYRYLFLGKVEVS